MSQLVALAARHRVPVSYVRREFVAAGGTHELRPRQSRCVSSGRALHRPYPQAREAFRPAGIAAGQIMELDHMKTARALGRTLGAALHGFARSFHMWRGQMPALAAAGYRGVAPSQRG